MRIGRGFVLVAVASFIASTIPSRIAWAETPPQQAAVILAEGSNSCVGDRATLVWTRPYVEGLTGYRVERWNSGPGGMGFSTTSLGVNQTSLPFNLSFFRNTFLIYAITTNGAASAPFASAYVAAGRTPSGVSWRPTGATVGDRVATVTFEWFGPVTVSTTGGLLPVNVRVTASPGGAIVDIPPGGTATFDGLTNGVAYEFSAVTSNACGSSQAHSSPLYTPGVAPSWLRATPRSTASAGQYVYKFAADGDPAPTYSLVGAPSWLNISQNGLVSGRPPEGVASFSYSVVASNGVGIGHPWFPRSDAMAGPFSVSVAAAHSK